ncbi:hypothetical protein [Paracoccus spongiarum]|uniref:Uncharacterized protein n=1 Tax=Paracoccus spongiarum TaxID=3064387 RepID=A0ABT9J7W5_9RHOB|nr:hypothetical protein [Paracoccus sp. 2205BS29-5]MDP5305894.1 hypothetical protein [Paracoccus sp. 2205BS29-5]
MIRAGLLLTALAGPVLAQEGAGNVLPCGQADRVDMLAEPWEDNTATYAEGQVRIALLDFVEPAGGAFRLMILSPPRDELGFRQCRVVLAGNGIGFYDMDFAARRSSYDPARGLTITLPARHYPANGDVDGDEGWFDLSVTIDQNSGDVRVQGFR